MPFAAAALADGQLPDSIGTLYTVPAVTTLYLKSLTLFNDNAAQQTIVLYLNRTGTRRKWRRFVLEQNESAAALDHNESIILEAADLIEAITTTAAAVDYTISGVLQT